MVQERANHSRHLLDLDAFLSLELEAAVTPSAACHRHKSGACCGALASSAVRDTDVRRFGAGPGRVRSLLWESRGRGTAEGSAAYPQGNTTLARLHRAWLEALPPFLFCPIADMHGRKAEVKADGWTSSSCLPLFRGGWREAGFLSRIRVLRTTSARSGSAALLLQTSLWLFWGR